jgi:hypothetical protein
MIGFYRDNLSDATSILQGLFLSMLAFFLGSQIGHEAERLWHVLLSDISHYAGTIILLASFSLFVYQKLGSLYVIIVAGITVIIVYFLKAIINVVVLVRNLKGD